APADEPPAVAAQHDVDALAAKPPPLVEPVRRPARRHELAEDLESPALWRRALGRQLEEDGLVDCELPEAGDAGRHPKLEPSSPRRPRHGDEAPLGPPDSRREDAAVERLEADASPPCAGDDDRRSDKRGGTLRRNERCDCEEGREPRKARPGRPDEERGGEADRRGRGDALRRKPRGRRARHDSHAPHGATKSRSSSRRAGPIPGTASSSSTELKAPCFWR